MVDYREILRLNSLGNSIRAIAQMVQSSRDTVSNTIKVAKATGITWPLEDDVTNEDLQAILFPGKYAYASPYTMPDFAHMHLQLARSGVSLSLLWEEYCAAVRDVGGVPYMYSQFCELYRRWAKVQKATMRIKHKPGDAMQVDWAGDPLYITDSATGELYPAYIFVAVLACSWYTYVEACSDMKQENWLLCHVHAFEYFGGVPRLVIPDNCKTATTENSRYDVVLNRAYEELADYYGTAIVPARVRKPDDKAIAEGTVKYVSTWITAALRDRKFFSLDEVRRAVIEKLEELNRRPFKKRKGCRATAFDEEERTFLSPAPAVPFEPATWLHLKVSYDYLVDDGKNKYSVPYDLIGKTVDVRLTRNLVEVFYHESRVALHVRLARAQRDPVVKPEHMPENHRKYLTYNEHDFSVWAEKIGPSTYAVVRYFLTKGREPEQGFKACASLTNLADRHGAKRLEEACAKAMDISSAPTIRNISTICKAGPSKEGNGTQLAKPEDNTYGLTRGANYYSKGGKHNA